MKYRLVHNEQTYSAYLQELSESGIRAVAMDIECESNLHEYGEKLCLVQVYDGRESVIIDPLSAPKRLVKNMVEDRSLLKIMFGASGDRAFLYKNYGWDILSMLDLQAAVLLLDFEKNDLASVLEAALSVPRGRSKKRFQRYNWNTRPLRKEAVEYALGDVVHLFDLKDRLLRDIVQRGLLEEFILKNLQVQNKPHRYNTKPRVLRSKKFKQLDRRRQRVFERLYALREKHAKRMNFAPNALLENHVLFSLAAGERTLKPGDFGKRVPQKARKTIIAAVRKVVS